jgi:cytochrome P450 family 135
VSLPPGPPWPAIIQTALVVRDPLGYIERCIHRYGDVFRLRFIGMGDLVYVANPEGVKEIFTGDPETFHAGESNEFMEPILGPASVLLLDEKAHLRQRRLLLPPFHGDSVRRYVELMREIAEREVAGWPLGVPFPIRPRMQAITLEVILRAVFGIERADRLEQLRSVLPRLLATSNVVVWLPWLRRNLGPWSPWARFMRVRRAADDLLYGEIRRRREEGDIERDDILSMLLRARGEDGEPMSDGELRDELMTVVVAGHETTATALAWAIELLLRNPVSLERLREELAAGDEAYLDAVVKETLRLRPVVVDVARFLTRPVQIRGREVPAGVHVVPTIAGVHLREESYSEPHSFHPERFLGEQPEPYSWIPFGGGVRRCIGASFAVTEIKAVLPVLLDKMSLRPTGRPERAKLRNVTIVPAKGTRVVAERRNGSSDRVLSAAVSSRPPTA